VQALERVNETIINSMKDGKEARSISLVLTLAHLLNIVQFDKERIDTMILKWPCIGAPSEYSKEKATKRGGAEKKSETLVKPPTRLPINARKNGDTQDKSKERKPCYQCGNTHAGACSFKGHTLENKESKVTWMDSSIGKECIAYSKANSQDGGCQPARTRGNDIYVANLGVMKVGNKTFMQMGSEEYKKWYTPKPNTGESNENTTVLTMNSEVKENPDNSDESMNSMECGNSEQNTNMLTMISKIDENPDNPGESMNLMESPPCRPTVDSSVLCEYLQRSILA
jgi:hypothetical protein